MPIIDRNMLWNSHFEQFFQSSKIYIFLCMPSELYQSTEPSLLKHIYWEELNICKSVGYVTNFIGIFRLFVSSQFIYHSGLELVQIKTIRCRYDIIFQSLLLSHQRWIQSTQTISLNNFFQRIARDQNEYGHQIMMSIKRINCRYLFSVGQIWS